MKNKKELIENMNTQFRVREKHKRNINSKKKINNISFSVSSNRIFLDDLILNLIWAGDYYKELINATTNGIKNIKLNFSIVSPRD